MKKYLTVIFSVIAAVVIAQSFSFSSLTTVAPGTGPGEASGTAPTYLVDESFEGTGTPGGWTPSGDVDFDETTTVVDGSQSLRIAGNESVQAYALSTNYGAQSVSWLFTRYFMEAYPSAPRIIIQARDATTTRGYIQMSSGGKLAVVHGASPSGFTTDAMSTGVWYYIWFDYEQGTGADGVASIEFSADGSKGDPNKIQSVSNGTSTTTVDNYRFYSDINGNTNWYLDRVLVDDVEIGASP